MALTDAWSWAIEARDCLERILCTEIVVNAFPHGGRWYAMVVGSLAEQLRSSLGGVHGPNPITSTARAAGSDLLPSAVGRSTQVENELILTRK